MINKLYYKIKCILGYPEFYFMLLESKRVDTPFKAISFQQIHKVYCKCGCNKMIKKKELDKIKPELITISSIVDIIDSKMIQGLLVKTIGNVRDIKVLPEKEYQKIPYETN